MRRYIILVESVLNDSQVVKDIRQACKSLADIGASETISKVSLLETAFAKGKDEVFFRTLLQNALENQGHITLREFTYMHEKHGSSADFLDLQFIERCDLLIRKREGKKFDSDALAYIELKAQAYGDFKSSGELAWTNAKKFWDDTFHKLNQYKLNHDSTACLFALIGFGIDKAKTDGMLHTYEKVANLDKRDNFLAFRDHYSKSMGMHHLFTEPILPRKDGVYDWLSLDFSLFSINYLSNDQQDQIIKKLYPNKLNDFAELRKKSMSSLHKYQLANFTF